jgi:hypothetical protein
MSDAPSTPYPFGSRAMLWSLLILSLGLGTLLLVRHHPEPGCNPIAFWKILLSEVIALGLVLGMYRDWRRNTNHRGILGSFAVVALHLYVPFSWLVLCDYPWSPDHLSWLAMWPVLPGIVAEAVLFHPADRPFLVMGSVMAPLLIGLTWLGTRGRKGRLAASTLALLVSVPSAWVAYWLFRF